MGNVVSSGAHPNYIFTFSHRTHCCNPAHKRLLQEETVLLGDNEDGSNILTAI